MNQDFEVFAKEFSEYFMRNYMIPWIKQHGVVMSYRAVVTDKHLISDGKRMMKIMRPVDGNKELDVPYAASAAGLEPASAGQAPTQCLVLCFGDTSNSIVVSDGSFDLFKNIINVDSDPRLFYGNTSNPD